MSEKDPRPRLPQVLVVLATAAVAAQLLGLYRPGGPPQPPWFPLADKLAHVLGFAAPLFLIVLARRTGAARQSGTRFVIVVTGIFAVHAVLSEVIQSSFYRYRSGDPFDVLADLIGMAVGLLGIRAVSHRQRTLSRSAEPGTGRGPR